MGSNLAKPVNPWIEIKQVAFKPGSVTLRAYGIVDEDGEEDVVYEVINTYTGKSTFSLTRAYAEWIFEACEERLTLDCMEARA